jgi:hypothetical protein
MAGLDAHCSATVLEPSANRHRSACGRRILGRDSLDVSEQVDEKSGEAPDRGSLDHVVGISAGIHAHTLIYIYIDQTHLYGFPLAAPPRPSSFFCESSLLRTETTVPYKGGHAPHSGFAKVVFFLFSPFSGISPGSRAPSLDTRPLFSKKRKKKGRAVCASALCARERAETRARGAGGVYKKNVLQQSQTMSSPPLRGTAEWSATREVALLLGLTGGNRYAAQQLWLRKERIKAEASTHRIFLYYREQG